MSVKFRKWNPYFSLNLIITLREKTKNIPTFYGKESIMPIYSTSYEYHEFPFLKS